MMVDLNWLVEWWNGLGTGWQVLICLSPCWIISVPILRELYRSTRTSDDALDAGLNVMCWIGSPFLVGAIAVYLAARPIVWLVCPKDEKPKTKPEQVQDDGLKFSISSETCQYQKLKFTTVICQDPKTGYLATREITTNPGRVPSERQIRRAHKQLRKYMLSVRAITKPQEKS